jgi:hypothetical protein
MNIYEKGLNTINKIYVLLPFKHPDLYMDVLVIIYLGIVSCSEFYPFNELVLFGFKTNKTYRKVWYSYTISVTGSL